MADAACRWGMPEISQRLRSTPRPAATAPEDTSTTRRPPSCRAESWAASDSTMARSSPSPVVSTALPTLTTTQRASVSALRRSARQSPAVSA